MAFSSDWCVRRGTGYAARRGSIPPHSATRFAAAAECLMAHAPKRFADVRERPVSFKTGIGHLPNQLPRLCFLPVAIEYVFWRNGYPRFFVRFGEPYETCPDQVQLDPAVWTEFLRGGSLMRRTRSPLSPAARPREIPLPHAWKCRVGVVYDRWRAFKAWWRGQIFQPEHGRL